MDVTTISLYRRMRELMLCTFEREESPVDEFFVVKVSHKSTGACCPEQDLGDAEFLSGIEGEAHGPVGDDTGDRGDVARRVLCDEQVAKKGKAGVHCGHAERGDVLRGIEVRGREAIGDGVEAKVREASEGRGAPRLEEAAVVVLGVDEGDVEATGVETKGQVQHGGYVALRWERDANRVGLLSFS
uniref:Rhombotin-2 n=1 Tax=Anthurium amnicola TaxID=1678845 RepID=A0A1D1XXD7_9ARAE